MVLDLPLVVNVRMFFFLLFLLIVEIDADFTVEPESVIQAEGLEAVFECLHLDATSYVWLVNGGPLSADSNAYVLNPTASSPARLAISTNNNSNIECEVFIRPQNRDDWRFEISMNSTLLFQGPLATVTSLTVSANPSNCSQLTISWSAPFSLNLTTADPDIQYCVDVYNVTGGGSHHLDSVCGITDTQYTYTAPDPTSVYNFTVTPRSNIQGSLNGTTSQPVQFGYVIESIEVAFSTVNFNLIQVLFQPLNAIHICQVSSGYSIEVQLLDANSSQPCYCPANISRSLDGAMTVLKLDCLQCELEPHSIYELVSFAGSLPSESTFISTHDVYEVTSMVGPMGQVEIVSKYLPGSDAKGFFVTLYSESDHHTLYRVVYRNGSEPSTTVTVSGLRNNVYRMAVYDLINNTLGFLQPEQQPAVLPSTISALGITGGSSEPTSLPSSITMTDIDGFVCMLCSPPGHGLSGCVGVIHSAPLDTYNLTVLTAEVDVVVCSKKRFREEFLFSVFFVETNELGDSPQVFQATFNSPPPTVLRDTTSFLIGAIAGSIIIILLVFACSCCLLKTCVFKKKREKMSYPSADNHSMHEMEPVEIDLSQFSFRPVAAISNEDYMYSSDQRQTDHLRSKDSITKEPGMKKFKGSYY